MSAATIATVPVRRCQALLAALALLGTGCTMCPDPFDYSGPVPNGSVSQNDFAARSNGIIPVRSTPLPWPPFVDARPGRPTPAEDVDATVIAAAGEVPAAVGAESGVTPSDTDAEVAVAEAAMPVSPAEPPALQAVPRAGAAPSARRRSRGDAGISEKPSWREAARSLFSL